MQRRSALLQLATAASVLVRPTAAFGQAPAPVRIGILPGDSSAEPLYAEGAGIYRKHGIAGQVSVIHGGAAVIAAVVGGSLDVGFSNVVSMAAAIQRGIPILMLAPASVFTSSAPDVLLVKARGSTLRTGKDLDGKTIAVSSLGGLLSVGASAWVDKNGGDSKNVHFLELPFPEMAAALHQNRIDAAMLPEPFVTEDRAETETLGDAFAAIAPLFSIGAFVVTKAWAQANAALARRFVAATVETAHWANTHHAATAAILAQHAKLAPEALATMTRATYGDAITATLLAPPMQASLTYGALKQTVDVLQIVEDAQPYWKGITRS